MDIVYRLLDGQVDAKVSEDQFEALQDSTEDAPLVPKYDPEDFDGEGIPSKEIDEVVNSPMVGAVQIGGSGESVTEQNMLDAIRSVQDVYNGILMMEPGKQEDIGNGELNSEIITGPDIFTKPGVWNTEDSMWINGHRRKAQTRINQYIEENGKRKLYEQVKEKLVEMPGMSERRADSFAAGYVNWAEKPESKLKQEMDSSMVSEIYYILNPESTAAQITGAAEDLSGRDRADIEQDVKGMIADLAQDGYRGIVYLEGSGAMAPPAIVESTAEEIRERGVEDDMILAYGGGVGTDSVSDLDYDTEMWGMSAVEQIDAYTSSGADIVLVGNSIQENGSEALR